MPSVHLTDLKYTASRGFACGRGYEWFEVSTRALNGRDSTGEGVIRGTAGVRERAHGEAVTHLGQEGLLQAPTHDLSAHAGVLEVRHTGDAPVGLREEGEGDRFSALPREAGFYLEAGGRRAARGRARGTGSGSEVTRTAELAAADILSFDRLDALARCQMDLHHAETPFTTNPKD